MTPEQHEIAARELCRLRGVDPDEKSLLMEIPYIRIALQEIIAREQLDQAMRAAACEYMSDGKCDES